MAPWRARIARLLEIAHEMLGVAVRIDPAVLDALPAPTGYATPRIDVRGALVQEGRILLVRERSDGRWTLPGGFADVGVSGARNVAREVREEAAAFFAPTALPPLSTGRVIEAHLRRAFAYANDPDLPTFFD